MPPESITATFNIVTAHVMKAYRGGVVTPSDFHPLSPHLQTQNSYDTFESLVARRFLWRVPNDLWEAMAAHIEAGRLPPPSERAIDAANESGDGGAVLGGKGSVGGVYQAPSASSPSEAAGAYRSLDGGGKESESATDPLTREAEEVEGGVEHSRGTRANAEHREQVAAAERMRAFLLKYEYITSASGNTASCGPWRSRRSHQSTGDGGVDGAPLIPGGRDDDEHQQQPRSCTSFVTLPATADRAAWARLAIALSSDKARLLLSQDAPLLLLLTRAVAWPLFVGLVLGAVRTAAVMAQVVALWILVRIAADGQSIEDGGGREGISGDWPPALRVLLSLVLPLGALVQSFGQHNTFHATNNGALIARSLVLALIYEKAAVMTPLYLGSASSAGAGASASKPNNKAASGPNTSSPANNTHAAQAASATVAGGEAGAGDDPLLHSSSSPLRPRAAPFSEGPNDDNNNNNNSFATGIAAVAGTAPVSTGLMVNMIASDANTILEAAVMLPLGLGTILDLLACLAWVGILAGPATAALFAAMLAVFCFQVYCGYRVSKNRLAVAAVCDRRLRALTEFLGGIQVVKFYAWESNVRRMVRDLRQNEATLINYGNAWKLISLTSTFCAPGLFYLCLFGVREAAKGGDSDDAMDAVTTFTIMALLATNVNRTFQVLPRSLTVVGTTAASMRRISEFLLKDVTTGLPRAAATTITSCSSTAEACDGTTAATAATAALVAKPQQHKAAAEGRGGLTVRGDFGWPGFVLKDVALHCPKGSLTVVIGTVGSGKSTLLQAVMGMCAAMSPQYTLELPPPSSFSDDGNASANHQQTGTQKNSVSKSQSKNLHQQRRIAYVPQEAFIAEATVRDNITFGLPFDEKKYRAVLKACSLVPDLQQWGGDLVEVSFATLSGGQRQRFSLARACYADADLYLIDDPISAVDATVGRHLLKHCFRGFLKGKTVLLATHHPAPARIADQIAVLDGSGRLMVTAGGGVAAGRRSRAASGAAGGSSHTNSPQHRPAAASTTLSQLALEKNCGGGGSAEKEEEALAAMLSHLETASAASGGPDLGDVLLSSDEDGGAADGNEDAVKKKKEQADSATNKEAQIITNASFGGGAAASAAEADAKMEEALTALLGKARALKVVEAEAIGAVPLSVYFSYLRGGGIGLLVFTVAAFALSQALRTVGDWWFSAWTGSLFPDLSSGHYLGIYAAIVAAMVAVACVRTLSFGRFTVRASSSLHDAMFESVIASPLHFFEQVPLGRIMNRFSKDVDYCDDLLPRVLFDLVQLIFLVCGSLSMQIYAVPWFAIAIPIACICFVLLLRVYMPASRYIKRIESVSRSPSLSTFQTVLGGLATLRAYGRVADYRRQYFKYCDVTINALLHSSCMQRWIAMRMDLVSAMWSLCAAVLCAALMHSMGGPSVVGLCLSQSVFLAGLFQFAVRMATETEMLMTSVERIDEYGTLPPEPNAGTLVVAGWGSRSHKEEDGGGGGGGGAEETSSRGAKQPIGDLNIVAKEEEMASVANFVSSNSGSGAAVPRPSSEAAVVNVGCLPADWPAGCDIVVKGLTVAHASNPTVAVLKNLHFTIRAGQRVAVVGRTGAGKSTLLSAFFRTLTVPHGSIAIGGVATTDVDVFCLRARLGIIPQVPTLFHGTFRYNLDPFGRYSDAAMLEALQKVTLNEYVAARQGLDTSVGEGGGNLSVGQRQLLCAARVLLTHPSILFMDEATANIDEETDDKIQQIMREEAARRQMTIVTIAHRLNTVMDYDLVIVLSHGRLVEVGNPRALAAAGVAEISDGANADASMAELCRLHDGRAGG